MFPDDPPVEGSITVDTLLRGRVTLLQPARGYRSSLDPVLLAAFVRPPFGRFVDIGCGTGALSFLLAAIDDTASGVGVELQPRLASLASAGLARNPFADRVKILEADVRTAVGQMPLGRAAFDLVATNPPYRTVSGGVPSPHPERARAHHEVTLALDEWLDAAAALVRPAGRVAVVFPVEREHALFSGLVARGFAPTRWRRVHPHRDRPAARLLMEAEAAGGAVGIAAMLPPEPPLVVHEPDGGFTAEVRRILGEG